MNKRFGSTGQVKDEPRYGLGKDRIDVVLELSAVTGSGGRIGSPLFFLGTRHEERDPMYAIGRG